MSVTSFRFYCRNCKFDKTYQTEEEVPLRCPQCNADSKFIIPHVRLPMEDASPEELIGRKVIVELDEHPFKHKFLATISGYKPHPEYKTKRLYILKLDKETARATGEGENLLFNAEGPRGWRGELLGGLMKKYRTFDCKASMEDLVLNSDSLLKGLLGRVYASKDPYTLRAEVMTTLLPIAYGSVFPSRKQLQSLRWKISCWLRLRKA